ncbi:hypothetical protein N7925_35575 [Streptomyces sp. CA-278952]|uniref:hypothetical protein n=1 Tax=unclassified Streptomyces TaxID=2593676 RepID=UPI0023676F12|nr:hypothetical protein [Streptomyces sp. CA-278952]WDG33277.1 hypothetical protein N7925_35575 [Streptomyces sp. CA-278952]
MVAKWPRTLPAAAGAAMPRSVIIRLIALPSPSGSRPSRRTAVVELVRRFGFLLVAPFFFAASLAASRAWRARSTPPGSDSVVMRSPPRRRRPAGGRAASSGSRSVHGTAGA